MNASEILKKYIKFYEDRGHKLVPNMSLVPEGDATLLFVNSGMFPLVPYLSGQPHPLGTRLVNVQRSLRLDDIENAGNTIRHTFAFHMIGNWSLGDYFKEEQLPWAYEFLIKELGLDPNRLFATVFAGDEYASKDTQSIKILQEIFSRYGVRAQEGERIFACGREDNWWQRGETVGELGGPDSETFYYLGEGSGVGMNPALHQDLFIEIGNSVFMQYKKSENGWEELPQKNVDFGGGLERISMIVQGKGDIFETDSFWPIIQKIEEIAGISYKKSMDTTKHMRILADHMRGSVLLAMDGVLPSNKDQGYILRRIIRRMLRSGRKLGLTKNITSSLVPVTINTCVWIYPDLESKQEAITSLFKTEEEKFAKTLDRGSALAKKWLGSKDISKLSSEDVISCGFDFYQSFGYPAEIFFNDVVESGFKITQKEFDELFKSKYEIHQSGSRAGAEQKFKGGLADISELTVKYHTATHLLNYALRTILGSKIEQKGSNITSERLRFDISFDRKLFPDEITQIEGLISEKISDKFPVQHKILEKEEALKTGALHFFGEKYGDQVTVYYIGNNIESAFSKEFCGGPHVKNLEELSPLKIYKQELIGSNTLRLYGSFN